MIFPIYRVITLLAVCMLAGACWKTVGSGTGREIPVNTNPSGAKVDFSDGSSCISPCNKIVSRKKNLTITISKDGCETKTVEIKSVAPERFYASDAGGIYGLPFDLAYGSLSGNFVDDLSGASRKLVPSRVETNLNCQKNSE